MRWAAAMLRVTSLGMARVNDAQRRDGALACGAQSGPTDDMRPN